MEIPESFRNSPYAREQYSRIVQWAKNNHPYYQHTLSNALSSAPILTREDVLDNNELLLNGHPVTGRTSGSTGVPVAISWSQKRNALEEKVTQKFVQWLGGTRKVTKIIHLGEKDQDDQYLDVNSPVDTQIQTLLRRYRENQAIALTTYPTNAERLCQAIIEQGIDMSFIERVGCYAEVFERYQEDLIQRAFPNAEIWTTYSSTEFGMIAARCPHEPDFHHIFAGKLGIEILDEHNQPCRDGNIGRIIITDYFNTHAPFIRYEIGDLGARGHCPCGKIDLPALSQVIGKVRGALVHRNGDRVPFTNLSVALRDIPGMRQYQVIQHELDTFQLRFVSNLTDIQLARLKQDVLKAFQDHFGYLPLVEFTQEPTIERGQNGKYYASISHL